MTLQMLKAGPAGATRVAVAARAPPDDSSTRVPSTPTPTRVPKTQSTSATRTETRRTWSAVVRVGMVWAFAAADPAKQVVADGWLLLPLAAVAGICFVLRERRAAEPVLPLRELRPPGAWGALLVNLLVDVAYSLLNPRIRVSGATDR